MSTVEATDKESRAVARARKKADRIRDKHANDLPRSMQPSALVKTITIVVLVFALIYFLFPIYWAIIASTKTPSQMTGSNGLWFAVGLSDLPAAIAKNYGTLIGWTRGQFWRWVLNSLIYSGVSALVGTLVAVMAGYATAKFNFKGKNLAIGVIMGCMADAGRSADHSAVLHLPCHAPDQHDALHHHPVLRLSVRLLPGPRIRADLSAERAA